MIPLRPANLVSPGLYMGLGGLTGAQPMFCSARSGGIGES